MKQTDNRFGTLFFEVRRAFGLTQNQLSTKLKMSQPHLSKIEAGKAWPDVMTWLTFCQTYHLAPTLPMAVDSAFLKVVADLRLRDLK